MSDHTLKDWEHTTRILFDDVCHAAAQVDGISNGCARRNYVRAVFTAIDGSTYGMKRVVLHVWKHRQFKLNTDDLELLTETKFDLRGKSKRRFLPFGDSVKFVFSIFAKVHGFVSSANYGGKGWSTLLAAAEIRHRLMHPKSSTELEVSDSDLNKIRDGADWYFKTRNQLVEKATSAIKNGI